MIQRVGGIQLDILANGGHVRTGRKTTSEVDRTEMPQLPLLAAIRIRGSFQRDREPQGQYGIDAVNEVSIATRGNGSAQDKRTFRMHFRRRRKRLTPNRYRSS